MLSPPAAEWVQPQTNEPVDAAIPQGPEYRRSDPSHDARRQGPQREWSEDAFVLAMHLVRPASVAYWSALNYWNLTEQVPRVTYVQTTAKKHKRRIEAVGLRFQIVTVTPRKFFGNHQTFVDHNRISVTDREKTLLDGLDRPDLCGGIHEVAKAIRTGGRTHGLGPPRPVPRSLRIGSRREASRLPGGDHEPRDTETCSAPIRLARRSGVEPSVIELDWAIGWALWGIARNELLGPRLLFKGGTCLRKCYIPDYRFSEDLDFTATVWIGWEEIEEALGDAFRAASEASGIDFDVQEPTRGRCITRIAMRRRWGSSHSDAIRSRGSRWRSSAPSWGSASTPLHEISTTSRRYVTGWITRWCGGSFRRSWQPKISICRRCPRIRYGQGRRSSAPIGTEVCFASFPRLPRWHSTMCGREYCR